MKVYNQNLQDINSNKTSPKYWKSIQAIYCRSTFVCIVGKYLWTLTTAMSMKLNLLNTYYCIIML